MEKEIPVKGAAYYYSAYDKDKNNKPCVVMQCTDGETSIIEYAKDISTAAKKANNWQKKENKAVTKSNQP